MSNGRGNQRGRQGGGGGGGGGNQRRRRGRSGGGGGAPRDNQPRGPQMTALGESTYEAVFDHGNEGYGVWFDGVVREDPMYRQFWKGNRPIFVKIEQDKILITKELDREDDEDFEDEPDRGNDARTPEPSQAEQDGEGGAADDDRDADDAEDGGSDSSDVVYSPEEAAKLFAEGGDADAANGDGATAKRKVTRRKKSDDD